MRKVFTSWVTGRKVMKWIAISILSAAGTAWSQGQSTGIAPAGAAPPAAPSAFDPRPYLPLCSTEKANGDCDFNINRNYPITMPTFQMKRGAHVSVYVFHPYMFELLTLDAGTPTAFEGSDQVSALLMAAGPMGKGAVLGIVNSQALAVAENPNFLSEISRGPRTPQDVLAQRILDQLKDLDSLLTQALDPLPDYFQKTRDIYSMVREIESGQPRPTADVRDTLMRGWGVPPNAPVPWTSFPDWRADIKKRIMAQAQDTTAVLDRLPQPCQKPNDSAPAVGLWLPSLRPCALGSNGGVQLSNHPFVIDASWNTKYQRLQHDIQGYYSSSHD